MKMVNLWELTCFFDFGMNMKKCSEIDQKIWNAMERFKKTCDWNHGFEFWAHNMRFPFNFLSANSPKNGWKTHSKKWRKNGSHFKVPITLFHFGPGKFQWVACTWGPLGHSPPKAGVFSLNATMLEDASADALWFLVEHPITKHMRVSLCAHPTSNNLRTGGRPAQNTAPTG